MIQRFWIVWNPQSKAPPTKTHFVRAEADHEARRLAKKEPGSFFHVLEVVLSMRGVTEVEEEKPISQEEADRLLITRPENL